MDKTTTKTKTEQYTYMQTGCLLLLLAMEAFHGTSNLWSKNDDDKDVEHFHFE